MTHSADIHEECKEREYEHREHILYLKKQITYLQEELASTEDRLNETLRRITVCEDLYGI